MQQSLVITSFLQPWSCIMVEYKGDKSERSFLSKRVLQNLRYHIKAKVGRRPSIVKILAIFIVFIIALKLLSTLDINITVHYGEPDSGSIHAVKEHNKVKPPVDEVRPLQPRAVKVPPPPRDIPNPQKANPAVRDRVHAFTGPQNESLIYLDYIDRNLPWDKKEEVCFNHLLYLSSILGLCLHISYLSASTFFLGPPCINPLLSTGRI